MPATLSLWIKEQYMAKWARGLSQQIAADAVGISVRSGQRIDRRELQAHRHLFRYLALASYWFWNSSQFLLQYFSLT